MMRQYLLLGFCWIMMCGAPRMLRAQTNDSVLPECKEPQQRMAAVLDEAKSKSAIDQYRDLVRFYASVGEDPPNCVTLDMLDQLDVVEEQLVALTLSGDSIRPSKALHCENVDLKTQICTGMEADDMHVRDTELQRKPARLPKSATEAVFKVVPGYPAKLVAVYGGQFVAMERDHGMSLPRMAFRDNTINVRRLARLKHPVIIAVFQCADELHFRKFVWSF